MTPPTVNAYYSSIDNKIGTYNKSYLDGNTTVQYHKEVRMPSQQLPTHSCRQMPPPIVLSGGALARESLLTCRYLGRHGRLIPGH